MFSDCRPGLLLIGKMKKDGDDDPITNAMALAMNRYNKITIVWIPGHQRIAGNHQADREAKRHIGKRIDYGQWDDWQFVGMENGDDIREMRRTEVLESFNTRGHYYY